ncbi:transcriptional regulator, Crp/Fnr family [Desulfitobacterium hafniense DCB-2]|uniref:Transcriptional regulator, Crp/Fnr family n=1 Tax=Desulfitobacterium hafniense (strain DSM 10664 / DCB-2) TaxID=272564 RepID=B8FVD5_DESHD|nr:transcriptional regulator, Crp/Fnr family [Desulfitobacterium hafniense DCB-2]
MQANRSYCIVPDNFYPVRSFQKYVSEGVVCKYSRGDTIVLPGESIEKVIYVHSGKVSLYFLEEKKEKLMYYARRHCVINRLFAFEMAALSHIVAEEDSEVCFFSERQLFEIFKQDEEAHREFLKNFTNKCGFFMNVSKEMDIYSPTSRVLRFIDELCTTQGKLVNYGYEIDLKLTQKTISEITGVHPVTVCKILGWLKEEGVLRKTSKKILIYDLPKLKKLINHSINC